MTAAQLLIAAAAGQPVHLPPELARKLLSCANDGAVSACLGLSLPQRIRVRNDALAQAAQELGADECTTWQAAQRLAQAVRRFERVLLPALQGGQDLPLTPHESALWRAYQVSGTRPLSSPRKLYQLLLLY
ncbi:MAG: hypothetical protein KKG12_09025 [Gammaproteobacteria bacterium]|nr:hypothetical protein [Gammaproteobacteria bacterium]